jgi:hypothetical protein
MKKQISTEETEDNIRAVLQLLTEMPSKWEALGDRISTQQLRAPLAPGERTPTEVLAHILHCEAITAEAIFLALLRDQPMLPDIHAERDLGRLLRLDMLSFAELLSYFKIRRTILVRVLAPLTMKKWSRGMQESKKERKESIYWRARGQALHELEHILDLETKLGVKS